MKKQNMKIRKDEHISASATSKSGKTTCSMNDSGFESVADVISTLQWRNRNSAIYEVSIYNEDRDIAAIYRVYSNSFERIA